MVKIPIIAERRRRTTTRGAMSVAPPASSGPRPDERTAMADDIEQLNPPSRAAVMQRMRALLRVLPHEREKRETFTAETASVMLTALFDALPALPGPEAWLVLAAINGRMPTADEVVRAVRKAELDGPAAAVIAVIREWIAGGQHDRRRVTIVTGRHLLDVQHTSRTDFATGIQRVTREVTRRWLIAHDAAPIGWREDFSGMRLLSRPEIHRACWGGPPVTIPTDDDTIVPWNCTYILPELAAESSRAGHLQTMAQFSNNTLNMIGYDLVPMTTAETSHEGLVPGFARNLAAARYARVIVPISAAAGGEYLGWRSMLAGSGLPGPRIEPVLLPAEAPPEDRDVLDAARARLVIGALPLVLVVGSHEPRKNHLAVLHAAELLWREGQQFSLTFIGGNAWNSGEFTATLDPAGSRRPTRRGHLGRHRRRAVGRLPDGPVHRLPLPQRRFRPAGGRIPGLRNAGRHLRFRVDEGDRRRRRRGPGRPSG